MFFSLQTDRTITIIETMDNVTTGMNATAMTTINLQNENGPSRGSNQ